MIRTAKAYYAGGHRVMLGGVPCRRARLPVSEGGRLAMRESSRDMCIPAPPRGRKEFAVWEARQLAAYNAADKLGPWIAPEPDAVEPVVVEAVEHVARLPVVSAPVTRVQPSMRAAALNRPPVPSIVRPLEGEQADATSGRMTIYGYCRVSTMTQADEGESLGVQERQIRGWAMMRGEDVAEIIVERGVSGSVPVSQRPEGARLWKSARKGDTIVCARLDRLFRSALDALQSVETMRARGVSIFIIDSLGEITGNGMAKAFLTISAAFAELERDTIKERIATVKADQRERGRYLGGKVPFGHRVDDAGFLEEVEDEQRVISFARELRKSGDTLRAIREKISEQHGRKLSLEAINRITG